MTIMCAFQDCMSVKYPCSKTAFFRLPNDQRRNAWIRNSGNKSLLKIGEKANRFFCEKHFRECDVSSQFNRKLLRKHAVPIEHGSLEMPTLCLEESRIYVDSSINTATNENETNHDSSDLVVELSLEDDSGNQNSCEEITALDISTVRDSPREDICEDPYRVLEFYDSDVEDVPTESILIEKPKDHPIQNEKQMQGESLQIYYDGSKISQVDISSFELEMRSEQGDMQTRDDEKESEIPIKKKSLNKMESNDPPRTENTQVMAYNNSYQEDKHFALSLVGYFQRLPQAKKALAKLKILQYLTELEIDLPPSL